MKDKQYNTFFEILIGALVAVVIILFVLLFFSGCYSERKAKDQFSKAAIAYPAIPAEYCATAFPVKDSIIKGDSIISFDTLYIEGGIVTDTVIDKDTVRITTTKTLPAKIITNTVHIRDTLIQENTAKIKACEIDKNKMIGLLEKKTSESESWQAKAKKRGKIMWLLILIIIGLGAWKIYSKFKVPIKLK